LDNQLLPVRTNILLETPVGRQKLVNFLKAIDTGIESLSVEKNDELFFNSVFNNPELLTHIKMLEVNKYKIRCGHKNTKGEIVYLDLTKESVGTSKFLILIGHIYFALLNGEVLIIDELSNSLHPQLAEFIVELFNAPEINSNNAQLIFTTYDITLMNPAYMRRDQLYFIDKDNYEKSELYSLDEFNEVRKNTPFGKWYMQNRFHATPNIDYSSLKNFLIQEVTNAKK
jgi:AAA15 family ATPase/GTPase